jgi:hypothetical protein
MPMPDEYFDHTGGSKCSSRSKGRRSARSQCWPRRACAISNSSWNPRERHNSRRKRPAGDELDEYLTNDAKALRLIDVNWQRSVDGAEYAIFEDRSGGVAGDPDDTRRISILKVLAQYSATELELAATADFLEQNGYGEDAWNETARRKYSKISTDRVVRAQELLNRLQTGS